MIGLYPYSYRDSSLTPYFIQYTKYIALQKLTFPPKNPRQEKKTKRKHLKREIVIPRWPRAIKISSLIAFFPSFLFGHCYRPWSSNKLIGSLLDHLQTAQIITCKNWKQFFLSFFWFRMFIVQQPLIGARS